MNKVYVLYHAHCTDGTGSKFSAWKKFGNNAEYIAVNYGQPVPEMNLDSEVYIVDFSYPRDVLEQLQSVHKSVIVLDHHKTAEASLKGCPGCQFDMHRSGCVMAWEYFHPTEPVPDLLLDIQDRDLWLFKRPNSKATHAGLQLLKGDMLVWNGVVESPTRYQTLVQEGRLLLKRQKIAIDNAVKGKVKIVNMSGHKVGITNTTDLASEIGSAICESKVHNVDFAICYCITNEDDVFLSFRSVGNFDVSTIAAKLGGGGHKNASGARIGISTLAKLIKGDM